MKLVIVIENDDLNELFAVGVKDLMNRFIPEGLKVKTSDIKRCTFEELRDESGENIISTKEALFGKEKYQVITHSDNFDSKNEERGDD